MRKKWYFPPLAILLVGSVILIAFQPQENMRLYVLDTGQIIATDPSAVLPGTGREVPIVMGDPSFLLVHPQGVLLWDTGLADSLINYPDGIQEQFARFELRKTLQKQLSELGYQPEDIDYLAMSHMHTDHTGNANLFTEAQVLMQPEEYEAAFGPNPEQYFFDPSTYDQLKNNVKVIDDGYDVFGDGSVIVRRAAGHTPGHQVLLVQLADTGPVLLAGDTYHTRQSKQLELPPTFSYDSAQSVAAMEAVEAMAREANAELWIQHDSAFNAQVNYAPKYYE